MNWKIYIALLASIAAIVIAGMLFWADEERPSSRDEPVVENEDDRTQPRVQGERSSHERPGRERPAPTSTRDRETDDPSTRPRRRRNGQAVDDERRPLAEVLADRRQDDRPNAPDRAADEATDVPDGGFPDAEDNRPWKDPTNQRVLGDKRWMAPISEEEREQIEEKFAKAREARRDPRLSNFDRRLSIERAREIVDACFDDLAARRPGVRGRLIVSWTTGAAMGTGWIANPRILTNVDLEDDRFEQCILQGLDGASYPADDGNAIEVEYPFFYDGT